MKLIWKSPAAQQLTSTTSALTPLQCQWLQWYQINQMLDHHFLGETRRPDFHLNNIVDQS